MYKIINLISASFDKKQILKFDFNTTVQKTEN